MVPSWLLVVSLAVLALLVSVWRAFKRSLWALTGGDGTAANPFRKVHPPSPVELVLDHKERDKVLKQSFSPEKVPESLDAIVIGSGIGGLTTAALLAKAGQRVLVLDQHDQAGGCCHTYIEKGFEFDTGIHYVGEMAHGRLPRVLLDQLCAGRIHWERLNEVYDTVMLEGAEGERRKFPVPAGKGAWEKVLAEQFPGEAAGIRRYFRLVGQVTRASGQLLGLFKLAPKWMLRLLLATRLLPWVIPALHYFTKPLGEVLDSVTSDPDLKAVLGYAFGNYGTSPKEASFAMHAMLTRHFTYGAYYPRGGASEIAFQIIPTIEEAGGKVLVRAPVREVLLNETKDRVVGVQVKRGHNVFDVLAPLVISDAGLQNTARRLLPADVAKGCGLAGVATSVKAGLHLMTVFIGLDGSADELGLKASNVWAFQENDLQGAVDRYVSASVEDAVASSVPLLFLSFPSTKDPTFDNRFPGKSTCEIITATPHRWFKEWENERVQHRGDDYHGIKTAIAERAWGQVLSIFPQLEERKEYFEVGTPLSNQYYLGSHGGEVYGVDHDVTRFSPSVLIELRPETGMKGLFLTGQDVMVCGFAGAMFGGLLCASAILQRQLMTDLINAKNELKGKKKEE